MEAWLHQMDALGTAALVAWLAAFSCLTKTAKVQGIADILPAIPQHHT